MLSTEPAGYERVHACLRGYPRPPHAVVESATGVEHGLLVRRVGQGLQAPLTGTEVENQRKRLLGNNLQRNGARLNGQIARIELPEITPVEFGGAARGLLLKKRHLE